MWVAELCAWNNGRGELSSAGLLGKFSYVNWAAGEGSGKASQVKGGSLVDQVGVNLRDEVPLLQSEVAGVSEDFEQDDQGQELKFIWGVREIAGLSCDGQEGKLKAVLGQLVDNKQGKGVFSEAGDDCIFNEA